MKSENKKAIAIVIVLAVIIAVSVFTAVIPGIASEPSNTPVTTEPTEEIGIEELQQRVYEQGYNYAVAENWITRLSPEDRKALWGYKHLTAPTEPLPENVRFVSDAPKVKTEKIVSLPSSYDAMALGYVTPVKDQAACGSCWLHGAIADFESAVAIGESNLLDFSEQEVGDCNIWASVGGHNYCEGGNAFMTTNYFTKYGAADEACHPYAATPETCQNCPILKNVDNWRIITGDDGESQITTIKNAILTYGPVYSTIYASDSGFSAYSSGVYEYEGAEETNHAIEIIGWNDSLGAWMIKNSWGTDWGASGPYPGCAWVAYGAANLGDSTSAISGYKIPSDEIFYHDECGWMGHYLGCIGKTTAYGAVRFTPSHDTTLTAVDFWAVDINMEYEISIFDTIKGGPTYYTFSDQLVTAQTGSIDEMGYYSIPLNTPILITSDDDFIVQVKFTTSTHNYPIPIDYCVDPDLNWAGIATSSGESYASCDGSQFEKYGEDGKDIGIRARAEVPNQPPTAIIDSIAPDPAEQVRDNVSFSGHGTDTDGFIVAYNWSSSIDGLLSTAPSFTKPASELSVGTHTITFKVQDDDGAWSTEDTKSLTINSPSAFDTCAGGYPSISGIHNGTITPSQDIIVQKMYTYPCAGTGGHTEYVKIWDENTSWNVTATWNGYADGDWQNITFDSQFTLEGGKTYNYTIRTGSYPQIIHEPSKEVTGGTITCDKFVDANGKTYNNWIPAIRLE